MTGHEFNEHFEYITGQCREMIACKAAHYTGDNAEDEHDT